jgi:hypothetical protein
MNEYKDGRQFKTQFANHSLFSLSDKILTLEES